MKRVLFVGIILTFLACTLSVAQAESVKGTANFKCSTVLRFSASDGKMLDSTGTYRVDGNMSVLDAYRASDFPKDIKFAADITVTIKKQ